MVTRPENNSIKEPESPANMGVQSRAGRNVDTPAGDVEASRDRRGPMGAMGRATRWGAAAMVWFALFCGAAGCVETAECNAAVSCPNDKVCYEYQCHIRCETQAQCLDDQVCAPCQTIAGTHDQGKCFGADLKACVDEGS